MLRLSELGIVESKGALKDILDGKVLINTINAHSFNTALKDELFAEALRNVRTGKANVPRTFYPQNI